MDIKAKIEEIVHKIKADKTFAAKFKSDPIKAVESVICIDLPDDQIKAVVDSVKAKLTAGQTSDTIGSIKKLF